jgi:hypothetical protein
MENRHWTDLDERLNDRQRRKACTGAPAELVSRPGERAVSGLNMIAARLSPGAISESSSSHLPASEASKLAKPVMLPLGRSRRATLPLAMGSATFTKTIGLL